MAQRPESDAEELSRLRRERADHLDEIDQLRRGAVDDAALISELETAADDAERVESAQRALIAQLRSEAGDSAAELDAIEVSLTAAERELGDLRAIRDALSSPAFVQRDGMTIAAELTPAEPEVGGDFYFVGDGPGGVAVVAVGDVVGKGLVAARRAAFARTALSSVAGFSDDPCQLLRWMNVALVERIGESGDFVTAICLTCDPASRRVRLATAGHHPALRLRSGDELAGARGGAALGLFAAINCESTELTLDPGEGLLLFTDGVTEARGRAARYGTDRLRGVLRRCADIAPDHLLTEVCADVDRFRAGDLRDDVCLVALRVD